MIWLLLSCWRPAPYSPPEAPEEALVAMEKLETSPVMPEEATAEDAPKEEVAEPQGPSEEEAPEPEEALPPPIEPYRARIISSPATLVNDQGQLVTVLDRPMVEVEVRAEEPVRKKVYCGSCKPAGEGWIQAQLVEKL